MELIYTVLPFIAVSSYWYSDGYHVYDFHGNIHTRRGGVKAHTQVRSTYCYASSWIPKRLKYSEVGSQAVIRVTLSLKFSLQSLWKESRFGPLPVATTKISFGMSPSRCNITSASSSKFRFSSLVQLVLVIMRNFSFLSRSKSKIPQKGVAAVPSFQEHTPSSNVRVCRLANPYASCKYRAILALTQTCHKSTNLEVQLQVQFSPLNLLGTSDLQRG